AQALRLRTGAVAAGVLLLPSRRRFFFSSRRRHTRFSRDWSSDVCSSDLIGRSLLPMSSRSLYLPIEKMYSYVCLRRENKRTPTGRTWSLLSPPAIFHL